MNRWRHPKTRPAGETGSAPGWPSRLGQLILVNPFVWGSILLGYATLLVLLLVLRGGDDRVVLEEGAIAPVTINASRPFKVYLPDPRAEQRVHAARLKVPRVFRYRSDAVDAQLSALHAAFAELRGTCEARRSAMAALDAERASRLKQVEDELRGPSVHPGASPAAKRPRGHQARPRSGGGDRSPGPGEPPGADGAAEAPGSATRQTLQPPAGAGRPHAADTVEDEVERAIRAAEETLSRAREEEAARLDLAVEEARMRTNRSLGIDPDDEVFELLEADCYSEAREAEAARVLSIVLDEYIVAYRGTLLQDVDRGIVVLRGGAEVRLENTRRVIDRTQAVDLVTDNLRGVGAEEGAVSYRRMRALDRLLRETVIPTIELDDERYAEALDRASADVATSIEKLYLQGQNIVRANQPVTAADVLALEAMQRGHEPVGRRGRNVLGVALLVIMLLVITYLFAVHQLPQVSTQPRDLLMFCAVLLVEIALVELSLFMIDAVTNAWPGLPTSAYVFAIPYVFGAMFVRLFVNSTTAVLYAILCALMVGILLLSAGAASRTSAHDVFFVTAAVLISSLVGIARMSRIRKRADVLWAGMTVGWVNALLVTVFALLRPDPLTWATGAGVALSVAGGLGAAFVVAALAPVIEGIFGYTTDIKLLELGSLDQPLLKELMLSAPGTYHHSIVVSSLAEAVAEDIGANPLVSRVAALYHDVGKIAKPEFFAENMAGGRNPHDELTPSMSALVLRAHVKEGARIARDGRLGREITSVAQQHHGTTLMRFFYQKAIDQCGAGDPTPSEADFRYPGPRPQSREAALVMLADSCEAATRSLPEKTPSRVRAVVRDIIMAKFTDGQLGSCDITLRDLSTIEERFYAILASLHHQRPQYPTGREREDGQGRARSVEPQAPADGAATPESDAPAA